MIPIATGVRVWLAAGHTDMRKGFDGLAVLVQETLKRNPHDGHLFVFRGRSGGLIKVLWHDGQGMCLFAKRLERGRFVWPLTVPQEDADQTVTITSAQLGYLLEGIDWRLPQHTWRPQAAESKVCFSDSRARFTSKLFAAIHKRIIL
jgi:transposase